MRAALAPLLFALSAACVAQPLSFELVVENADPELRYVESHGEMPLVYLDALVGDDWSQVAGSPEALCARPCGQLGGSFGCISIAQAPPDIYALLPGDSVTRPYDMDEAWAEAADAAGTCARRIDLSGALRATVCHAADADIGEADEPEASGVVVEADGWLENPVCSEFDFVVEEADEQIVLPIEET